MIKTTSTGNFSIGNHSTGDHSTGHSSTGNRSTGHRSTGHSSTGHCSTGHCSTGHSSTGNHSTGDWSTGNHSTGNHSTGHSSTGDWSISSYSAGHFSTIDYSGFGAFNKPCTPEEWNNSIKPKFLYFELTEWIYESEMSEQEKEDHDSYRITGGFLKVYDYKEAFQESYKNASNEDKELLLKLPNFDADVFFEISGIDVRKNDNSDKIEALVKSQKELFEKANLIQKEIEGLR